MFSSPFLPFPTCRRILTQKQQTTFEKIVAKGEIAHDKKFLLWPQYFQFDLTIKLSFMEIVQDFGTMFSKSLICRLACATTSVRKVETANLINCSFPTTISQLVSFKKPNMDCWSLQKYYHFQNPYFSGCCLSSSNRTKRNCIQTVMWHIRFCE